MTSSEQFAVGKIGVHVFTFGFTGTSQKDLPLISCFQLGWVGTGKETTSNIRRKIVAPPAGYEWYSMDPKVHTPDPGSEAKPETANDLPPTESRRERGPRPEPVEAARSATAVANSDRPFRWVAWILLALAVPGVLIWRWRSRSA